MRGSGHTMVALLLSCHFLQERKNNSTVSFFVEIALKCKPTLSVGNAKGSDGNLILSQCKHKTALLIDSYQKPRASGVAGSRNQTVSLGHGISPSVWPHFLPLSGLRSQEGPAAWQALVGLAERKPSPSTPQPAGSRDPTPDTSWWPGLGCTHRGACEHRGPRRQAEPTEVRHAG